MSSYLPLIGLAALVAWPLFLYGPPLQSEAITDGPNHLYRFVSLAWHIRHGDFYPRWFSNLHFGFGAPVLNFYAPLSYYLLVLLHLFIPSAPAAFGAGFILAIGLAVAGMYLWARDHFHSPEAGLTAAAAYGLVPYLYNSILDRAAYPETWALAIAPWVFHGCLRLNTQPTARTRLVFVLLYAALILTHNLSALLFTPLLVLYAVGNLLEQRRAIRSRSLAFGLSLVHSLGLAAFFLLPFLAEAPSIQLERTRVYDYAASHLAPQEMFSLPIPFDPNDMIHSRPNAVPWPQLVLIAVGLIVAILSHGQRRKTWFVAGVIGLAILLWLASPASAPLWSAPPFSALVRFIQFPFRWLGLAMLVMGWLGGAVVAMIPAARIQRIVTLGIISVFFLYSLPWTFHEPFDIFPDTFQPADIIRDEIAHPTRIGTTNVQEFLPRWVEQLPPSGTLLADFAASDFPSRSGSLPADVTRLKELTALNRIELEYESPRDLVAPFNIFYFPGWAATVDGQPASVQPSSTYGLVEVALPGGHHLVRITLQPTLSQIVGTALSAFAAMALIFLRRSQPAVQHFSKPEAGSLSWAYSLLAAILLVSRLLVFDRLETPFRRSALDTNTQPFAVRFGGQLELIGVEYDDGTLTSGGTMPVTLYWRALTPLAKDYQVSLQLADDYGNRFGNSNNPFPGGLPTSQWKTARYARDEHLLPAVPGAPPGTYHLLVNVHAADNSPPLTTEIQRTPSGPEVEIGTIIVVRPPPAATGPLRLVEASLAVTTAGVGDPLPFTLVWHSGDQPLPRLWATVTLTDSQGRLAFSTTFPPARPDYPTDQWSSNERVLYPHTIILPPDLPAGPARLSVFLADDDGRPMTGPDNLGSITITVPERSFSIPPMQYSASYDFDDTIRLLGYDLAPQSITLYWQALRPVSLPLTVFVHRLDSSGRLIAGHDSPPPRSTTSWLPGEVITDVHPIEAGDHFEVGLYESATGQRFGAPMMFRP
jgi:hypothetical protein